MTLLGTVRLAAGWGLGVALGLAATGAAAPAQERVVVLEEPDGLAVGVAAVLGAGGAWDLEGQAGWAHLTARAALEAARPGLERLGARADLTCDRAMLQFTLVAPPDDWEAAARILLRSVLRPHFGAAELETARRELLRRLEMQLAGPGARAEAALEEALFGNDRRWARPPCGDSTTLTALTLAEARRLAESRFRPSGLVVAVAGPVAGDEARSTLAGLIGAVDGAVPRIAPRVVPAARRVTLRENAVTAWVKVAFPIGGLGARGTGRRVPLTSGADDVAHDEALELLAYVVGEQTRPGPTNPEVFDASVTVDRLGDGAVLTVSAIVAPESADAWIGRIRRAVEQLARTPTSDGDFTRLVRRYRGARLLELATPEARALDAARQLYDLGVYAPVTARIDGLSPEALRGVAAAAGDPAIAVLAPDR